jgi:hypothetical protein
LAAVAFRWTEGRERAAALLAEDRLSDEDIANLVGITRQALQKWKARPEFMARVDGIVEKIRIAVEAEGIANKVNRVALLNDMWRRQQAVIAARAGEYAHIPGGDTGLLVRTVNIAKVYEVGDPDDERMNPTKETILVEEYAVDTGLLKEMRETAKQAAIELRQWTEQREETHKPAGPLEVNHKHGFSPDGVGAILEILVRSGAFAAGAIAFGGAAPEPFYPAVPDGETGGLPPPDLP